MASQEKADHIFARFGNKPMIIFLKNGIKLTGTITDTGLYGIDFTRDRVTQLIEWDAVATYSPLA